NRAVFVKFVIFTDGPEEIMAAVEPVEEGDLSRWVLAVDIEDIADVDDLNYTLIHEYAHVMTLDDSQVASGVTSESCDEYALFEGCALPRAYLNAFYEKFWADVFAELGVSSEDELTEDMMVDYYEENEDSFVTDYASTNPGEDIAESFTVFVLQPKPAGDTIAEQKVLFFYDYPELVRLRGDIASRLFSRMRRQAAGE
ncbi:MAG TPA: hypothetical protein VLL52_03455, partial [Anaerolineae bacterium]|nr:hypothetical protein [Anaerolineae bacterium]